MWLSKTIMVAGGVFALLTAVTPAQAHWERGWGPGYGYGPPPVYYAPPPPPIYYAPPPAFYGPPPGYYAPPRAFYGPPPTFYVPPPPPPPVFAPGVSFSFRFR